MRCTAGIKISEFEYARIVEELRGQEPRRVRMVLEQAKELPWFEEITYTACLLLDVTTGLCIAYAARPLVCRLFGLVPHLPCPLGRVPADLDARRVLEGYVCQPMRTFQEWMAASNIFNFDDLLGVPHEPPTFEV